MNPFSDLFQSGIGSVEIAHMRQPSREASALRGLLVFPHTSEGAERRQALGCSGTRRRASDGGPQAPSGALRPMTRDVRLSALHRGVYGSGPARDEASLASPSASSSRPLVVAEGSVSGASRVLLARQQRRTPHPALPMRCLAASTLKRTGRKDSNPVKENQSNESGSYEPWAVGNVLMGAMQTAG